MDRVSEAAPDILKGAIRITKGISGVIKDVTTTVENLVFNLNYSEIFS